MSATKEFGYDKKQIVGPVDDDLLCVICFSTTFFPGGANKCKNRPASRANGVHEMWRHVLQTLH